MIELGRQAITGIEADSMTSTSTVAARLSTSTIFSMPEHEFQTKETTPFLRLLRGRSSRFVANPRTYAPWIP